MFDLNNFVDDQIGAYLLAFQRFLQLAVTGLGLTSLIMLIVAACGELQSENVLTKVRILPTVEKSHIHNHNNRPSGRKERP